MKYSQPRGKVSNVVFLVFSLFFAFFFLSLQATMSKNLYIISGCNGAGKTTASYTVLPEILDCREFVNADDYDNSGYPRKQVACGGKNAQTIIYQELSFAKIQSYVE